MLDSADSAAVADIMSTVAVNVVFLLSNSNSTFGWHGRLRQRATWPQL